MSLQRSRDKVLGGVCGGLAEEWDMDPTVVRLLYVVFTLLTGIGIGLVVYLVLYLVMDDPEAPSA
jgi:phage shock protein C